jgi:hypothetical protein
MATANLYLKFDDIRVREITPVEPDDHLLPGLTAGVLYPATFKPYNPTSIRVTFGEGITEDEAFGLAAGTAFKINEWLLVNWHGKDNPV